MSDIERKGSPLLIELSYLKNITAKNAAESKEGLYCSPNDALAGTSGQKDDCGGSVTCSSDSGSSLDQEELSRVVKEAGADTDNNANSEGTQDTRETESKWDTFLRKCSGGLQKPPPGASIEQSLTTFAGAFLTLLILSGFYTYVNYVSNGKYHIMLAPFGALVTLQFGLTGAPAAQPRQAIYGELIVLPISILINSVPHYILPSWIEIALAPAIGIGVMQYLGLTHPPAGAAAIVFSHLDYGWVHLLLFEAGVVISVLASTIVNNLNEKRQYPTYWNLLPEKNEPAHTENLISEKKHSALTEIV
jgi:hypothetical protein